MKFGSEFIIGYELRLQYNNTFMFDDMDQAIPHCPHCGLWLEPFQHRLDYNTKQRSPGLRPRKYDIALTCDHRYIASEMFRDFCSQSSYDGIEYLGFTNDLSHFQLKFTKSLRVDRERSHIRFGKLCPVCHRYDYVLRGGWVGTQERHLILEVFEPIREGFFRTDLRFASGNKQFALIIVGIETAKKLRESHLTGVLLLPVYGLIPGEDIIPVSADKVENEDKTICKLPVRALKMRPKRRRKPS